ncbi:MAG TPA: hypothetical protein VGI98_09070 [Candidatus Limnocylindrales bacterium]|jgi:hypothetical protein
MSTPEQTIPPRPPALRRWSVPLALLDGVAAAFDRLTGRLAAQLAHGLWEVLHVLGAHRWREGWETNIERGWRQYRGSRCTICDVPWEGW